MGTKVGRRSPPIEGSIAARLRATSVLTVSLVSEKCISDDAGRNSRELPRAGARADGEVQGGQHGDVLSDDEEIADTGGRGPEQVSSTGSIRKKEAQHNPGIKRSRHHGEADGDHA